MIYLKYFVLFLFFNTAITAFSQTKIDWKENYAEALKISNETGKPVLIFFSGSDWCKPCIKLKKYILDTDEFAQYAAKFVPYNADFPYRIKQSKELKKQNEELAEKYNQKGEFPKVVFVKPDGAILGSTGFIDCTPQVYIEKVEQFLK